MSCEPVLLVFWGLEYAVSLVLALSLYHPITSCQHHPRLLSFRLQEGGLVMIHSVLALVLPRLSVSSFSLTDGYN